MSKNTKYETQQNNLNAKSNNRDQEEDPIESPFWFWFWIGILAIMFVGFALFNKYCVNNNDAPKQNATPSTNVETSVPTTDQPSVTK